MQVKNVEEGISICTRNITVFVSLLFLIFAIVLNYLYRQPLFIMGVNDIYQMQSHQTEVWNFIENSFSLLGHQSIVIPIIACQYLFSKRKILAFVHLIYIMTGLYFMALLKQIYQQARPFWYSNDIKALGWFCPTDFGNPSGHSFIIIALYEPLFSDFIGAGTKKIAIMVWVLIVPLVMVSRMYLGDHSLDQIMFGALLGISFLVIYRFKLQHVLYNVLAALIKQQHKIFYFTVNTIALIIAILVPMITYQLNLQNRTIDQSSIDSINQNCSKSFNNASLKSASLDSTVSGFLSIGIIYGFILLKNEDDNDLKYMLGQWKSYGIKSFGFYILGLLGIAVPAVLLIKVIPSVSKEAEINFFLMVFGAVWAGIGLAFVIPWLQNRFGWVAYTNGQLSQ